LVVAALAWGVVSGARWITPPSALMLLLAGALAATTGEFVREGARKPYRIEKYLLAPGVLVSDVPKFQSDGFITRSRWLRFYLHDGATPAKPTALDGAARIKAGEGIFQYHCASCHAEFGYNGIKPIIYPWTAELIHDAVRNLHRTNPAMPPWLGTPAERDLLAAYLLQLNSEEHKK
jgi:mono/diheme cytochrome c family protein